MQEHGKQLQVTGRSPGPPARGGWGRWHPEQLLGADEPRAPLLIRAELGLQSAFPASRRTASRNTASSAGRTEEDGEEKQKEREVPKWAEIARSLAVRAGAELPGERTASPDGGSRENTELVSEDWRLCLLVISSLHWSRSSQPVPTCRLCPPLSPREGPIPLRALAGASAPPVPAGSSRHRCHLCNRRTMRSVPVSHPSGAAPCPR